MQDRSLTKRKSPLAWVGGKSKLTGTIIPLIPAHKCYVEVFAGAAWVLFRKEQSKVEVINDINGDLITLYRVLQNHLEEFVRYFKWSLISRDEFERQLQVAPHTLTDIQRSARFYYLVRTSFGAKAVNQTFGVANSTSPRLNFNRIAEDLTEAHLRLSRVTIENLNYAELITRYDGDHVFFSLTRLTGIARRIMARACSIKLTSLHYVTSWPVPKATGWSASTTCLRSASCLKTSISVK